MMHVQLLMYEYPCRTRFANNPGAGSSQSALAAALISLHVYLCNACQSTTPRFATTVVSHPLLPSSSLPSFRFVFVSFPPAFSGCVELLSGTCICWVERFTTRLFPQSLTLARSLIVPALKLSLSRCCVDLCLLHFRFSNRFCILHARILSKSILCALSLLLVLCLLDFLLLAR
jgi:hypothetical protein